MGAQAEEQIEWVVVRSKTHAGTWYSAVVAGERLRVFMHDDMRKAPQMWRWDEARLCWIRECNSHHAHGVGKLTVHKTKRSQVPGIVTMPAPEPVVKPLIPVIERRRSGQGGAWVERQSIEFNDASRGKVAMAAERGQTGNRGIGGNM